MAGFYCNKDWYQNNIYPAELSTYKFWYSRPGLSAPDLKCDLWQNNIDKESFPGVAGKVDLDVSYINLAPVRFGQRVHIGFIREGWANLFFMAGGFSAQFLK